MRSQLLEDGTYPNAEAAFALDGDAATPALIESDRVQNKVADFDPSQPRDPDGRWASGRGGARFLASGEGMGLAEARAAKQSPAHPPTGSTSPFGNLTNALNPIGPAAAQEIDPEEERGLAEESSDPTQPIRTARYYSAMNALRAIDPKNPELVTMTSHNYEPSENVVQRVEAAAESAAIKRVCDFVVPDGKPIGQPGNSPFVRVIPGGGLSAAKEAFDYLSVGGVLTPIDNGLVSKLPGSSSFITLRPNSSSPGSPAVDLKIPGLIYKKIHY